MPRAPAFKIAAIADLLRQLEYAPPETRKRQMDAAEKLVSEIDADRAFPCAFVTYRITGYRPDSDDMTTFAGLALRADLANFVQRLSDGLSLEPKRGEHAALSLVAVARRLGVSAKTVQRYRREGLVCHVVASAQGKKRLACYADALERFISQRTSRIERAGRFTRISDDAELRIISEARALRAARPISLNAAAKIIARQHSRAHETIRQILRKHDRDAQGSDRVIFDRQREAIDIREVAIMHRAWMRGIELAALARRFDRSRPAILRAINRKRAELLRKLRIHAITMPTFAMEGADAVILSAPAVSSDLFALPPHDDAFRLLDWAGIAQPLNESIEDAMLGGWNLLKWRAAKAIAELPRDEAPTSEAMDAIETDLRWATRLHRRLTLLSFPAVLRRVELNLGRSLITQTADHIAVMMRLSAGVIREALESVDPSRGQRLERIVAFAMERELAQRSKGRAAVEPTSTRAAARHAAGASIPLRDVFDAIDEWEPWLEPWRNLRGILPRVDEPSRSMLMQRFGWDGRRPRTMREIAAAARGASPATARRMQEAVRELRRCMAVAGAAAPQSPA